MPFYTYRFSLVYTRAVHTKIKIMDGNAHPRPSKRRRKKGGGSGGSSAQGIVDVRCLARAQTASPPQSCCARTAATTCSMLVTGCSGSSATRSRDRIQGVFLTSLRAEMTGGLPGALMTIADIRPAIGGQTGCPAPRVELDSVSMGQRVQVVSSKAVRHFFQRPHFGLQ